NLLSFEPVKGPPPSDYQKHAETFWFTPHPQPIAASSNSYQNNMMPLPSYAPPPAPTAEAWAQTSHFQHLHQKFAPPQQQPPPYHVMTMTHSSPQLFMQTPAYAQPKWPSQEGMQMTLYGQGPSLTEEQPSLGSELSHDVNNPFEDYLQKQRHSERVQSQQRGRQNSDALTITTADSGGSYISSGTTSASNTFSLSSYNSSSGNSTNAFTPFTPYAKSGLHSAPLSATISPRSGYAYKPTTKLESLGDEVAVLLKKQLSTGSSKDTNNTSAKNKSADAATEPVSTEPKLPQAKVLRRAASFEEVNLTSQTA
ncbi:unnamed protein product, partial [Rotaria socialis]